MNYRVLPILFAGFIFFGTDLNAQIYGNNIFEFQYGNLPYQENRDLTTSYDQLNLFYDQGNISAYGRFEQFLSPYEDRNYFQLTQKRLQYQDEHFNIRLGNFYETIGRGLLLRSYEIPGSVFEDQSYRTRYAFNRDLEGIAIELDYDWVEAKALRSRPLYNIYPPNIEPDSLRRPDLVEAVEVSFTITDAITAGGAFMRSHINGQPGYEEYASLIFNANTPFNLQVYSEYAFNTEADILDFNNSDAYALYTGLNYYRGSFGASLEYKNYNRFILGSGYNNPPSLIKEHTYPVLNRKTHVLDAFNESGLQMELFYNFEGGHSLVGNYTAATNDIGIKQKFYEYFVEGTFLVTDMFSIKSFVDYAKDELMQEENRISAGIYGEKNFNYAWSLSLDLQYQTFDRTYNDDNAQNYYMAFSLGIQPDFIISTVLEMSTDQVITDDPRTFDIESDTRIWLGANIRYKINRSHTLDVFAGKRRGGPSCTSGICYEILDFEGIELRFSTRF